MTLQLPDIDVIVFDILGTLVDEPTGIRTAIHETLPTAGAETISALAEHWQRHIAEQQSRIADGARPYVDSEELDAEAADIVLGLAANIDLPAATDPDARRRLASASHRLPPWPDSVTELTRICARFPVLALSNAAPTTLLYLAAHTGLRWHAAVSADDVHAYKPAPEPYRRAIEIADRPADRILMVAAHAWDLRAARDAGMRTCYVDRPVGDPPAPDDHFDLSVSGLTTIR
ncbi:haloacid dehalogenase type II [Microbacterium sp.]|uniref:haloacid dehalogenase type II n=1 Tax=Microbacterium sp. TaxID=51671 RepID=UPI003F9D7F0D